MEPERRQMTVVTGCVLAGDRVLLTQRYQPDIPQVDRKWELPGGRAEFAESPEEVVVREVKEETGLDVVPKELIPYIHTNLWKFGSDWLHVIVICYLCEPRSDTLRLHKQPTEVRSVRWMSIGDIDFQTTMPGTREFLSWVKQQHLPIQPRHGDYKDIYLEKIEPATNTDKYYFLTDRPPTVLASTPSESPWDQRNVQLALFGEKDAPASDAAYFVCRAWGRRGSTPRFLLEEYWSAGAVLKRFTQIVNERRARGYRIGRSTIGGTYEQVLRFLLDHSVDTKGVA